MKVETVDNWRVKATYQTQPGKFWGVAIGPESDDARVRVNGVLLQAGRVLPLRTERGYTIERVTGRAEPLDAAWGSDLMALERLELLLFECEHELGVEVARPDGTKSDSATITNIIPAEVVYAPFVGRRQALIHVRGTSTNLAAYEVIGRRWSKSQGALVEKELTTGNLAVDGASGVAEVALYVGGTNESEAWDELLVKIGKANALDADELYTADVVMIGEAGL